MQREEARSPDAEDTSFSAAFARELDARGLTLEGLRRRLAARGVRISPATLSYWRAGRRQPERQTSLDALREIEDLLGLPAGTLSNRLERPRRPGPRGQQVSLAEQARRPALVGAALAELELPDPSDLVEVWIHHVVDINEQTRRRTCTARGLFRAEHEGVDRKALVLTVEQPLGDAPTFDGLVGCRLGRRVFRPADGVFAVELLLEHPLRSGEEVVLEYQIVLPETARPEGHFEYSLVRRVREAMIWVRFHGDRTPTQTATFTVLDEQRVEHPVRLPLTRAISTSRHSFGPGKIGVSWIW